MSATVQMLVTVTPEVHAVAKVTARARNLSVSAYVDNLIRQDVGLPAPEKNVQRGWRSDTQLPPGWRKHWNIHVEASRVATYQTDLKIGGVAYADEMQRKYADPNGPYVALEEAARKAEQARLDAAQAAGPDRQRQAFERQEAVWEKRDLAAGIPIEQIREERAEREAALIAKGLMRPKASGLTLVKKGSES